LWRLKTDDVIIEVGGKKVATGAEVRDAIDVQKDGKRAVLIRLKSDNVTSRSTTGRRPAPARLPPVCAIPPGGETLRWNGDETGLAAWA
jgi:hypothetical protein